MSQLQLGPQEQAVYELFLKRRTRTLKELEVIYTRPPAKPGHALTAVLRALNRKLAAARKGRIERISHRGRGHVGRYQLKRR